jgi:hypothetical protein
VGLVVAGILTMAGNTALTTMRATAIIVFLRRGIERVIKEGSERQA